MSKNRCFSNPNKCKTCSDYTKQTKQQTIFTDVVQQVQTQNNFIKSNGVNYNENFGLHNDCLAFAKSYELLLDVTKGKYYTAPVQDPTWISNEAWSAGLYSVDYSANQVNTVVDTSYNAGNTNHIIFPMIQPAELADLSWNGVYPGVIVDPSYNIFYNRCKDENYWRKKIVDMSFNNTNYSKQSKEDSEQLYGMYYPTNIKFNLYPNTDIPCDSSIHGSAIFNYTGTIQTFTKPAGVCVITIEAIGGGGGGSIQGYATTYGGGGGKVTSSFNVPLCKCSFNIYVGGQGNGFVSGNTHVMGGISLYNYSTNGQTGSGGTVNYNTGSESGGGGALSCVIINQQGSTIQREMLIIAGGGGGGSDGFNPPSNGGFGGGSGTADGQDAPLYSGSTGGKGGKADGTGGAGPDEILTTGGSGGSGGNSGNNVGDGGRNHSNGAGGGGGYGGGGGGTIYNAGGGGSSFSNGYNTTYAYISTHTNSLPGEGGTSGNPMATSGQPGKITITY